MAGQTPEELVNRGERLSAEGRFGEAEVILQRAIRETEDSVGKDHPAVRRPVSSLVSLYLENGMPERAERLLGDPPELPSSAAPADPSTISLLHNFAALFHAQRRYVKAEAYYRGALSLAERTFGVDDERLAQLLNNLGLLLAQQGRREKAVPFLERTLAILQKALGPNHPNLAKSMTNLGALYCSLGSYAKAEPLFQQALSIVEITDGLSSRLAGRVLAEYAVLNFKTGRKAEGKAMAERAREIQQSYAGQDLGRHRVDVRDLVPLRQKYRTGSPRDNPD